MAYVGRLGFFATIGAAITATLSTFATTAGNYWDDVVTFVLTTLSWAPRADESIALDRAMRRHFALPLKLPSWSQFLAFIGLRKNHGETVGDGYLPEGMFAIG